MLLPLMSSPPAEAQVGQKDCNINPFPAVNIRPYTCSLFLLDLLQLGQSAGDMTSRDLKI